MKISVFIDQRIGAEIFPSLPTSRHFGGTIRMTAVLAGVNGVTGLTAEPSAPVPAVTPGSAVTPVTTPPGEGDRSHWSGADYSAALPPSHPEAITPKTRPATGGTPHAQSSSSRSDAPP